MVVERANVRRDRHIVVIEDDQHVGVHCAGIVQCLEGHAGRHCAIADDGDGVTIVALSFAGHRHASAAKSRCSNGRRRRCRIPFFTLGKTGQAAFHAQLGHAFAASVRILCG